MWPLQKHSLLDRFVIVQVILSLLRLSGYPSSQMFSLHPKPPPPDTISGWGPLQPVPLPHPPCRLLLPPPLLPPVSGLGCCLAPNLSHPSSQPLPKGCHTGSAHSPSQVCHLYRQAALVTLLPSCPGPVLLSYSGLSHHLDGIMDGLARLSKHPKSHPSQRHWCQPHWNWSLFHSKVFQISSFGILDVFLADLCHPSFNCSLPWIPVPLCEPTLVFSSYNTYNVVPQKMLKDKSCPDKFSRPPHLIRLSNGGLWSEAILGWIKLPLGPKPTHLTWSRAGCKLFSIRVRWSTTIPTDPLTSPLPDPVTLVSAPSNPSGADPFSPAFLPFILKKKV